MDCRKRILSDASCVKCWTSIFPHAAAARDTVPASLPVDLKWQLRSAPAMGGYNESVVLGAAAATDLGMRRAFPTVTKGGRGAGRGGAGRPGGRGRGGAAAGGR